MKKIMMTVAVAVAVVFTAAAQKIKEAEVPEAVKTAFVKQYPGVAVKWEKEDGLFEAGFKKEGSSMSALYEANGTVTETEIEMPVAELPAVVLDYVKEHYSGKKIKEASRITKADGTLNYEAEVAGKDVLFDATGKFIKEAKD